MDIMIDLAIAVGAFCAAAYCLLLSRRVRALTRLDGDLGKAIALLSRQVDDLSRALKAAEQSSNRSGANLAQHISTAEAAARRLELLMAAQRSPDSDTGQFEPEPAEHAGAGFMPLRQAAGQAGPDGRKRVLRQREQGRSM